MDDKGKDKKRLDSKDMQEKLKGDSFPNNWDGFLDDDIRVFFDNLFEQTGHSKAEVIRKANISRSYGYQIMEGRRLGTRDYYLAIALVMSLDLSATQRMLGITHCGGLHPLVKRDAAVIFAINHGYSLEKTYDFMCELELPPLDTGIDEKDDKE